MTGGQWKLENDGKGWREARKVMEPEECKYVEKGERGLLCGWLEAPVLLGGRGRLNKQS